MTAPVVAQNQDAERSVLGGVILDNSHLAEVSFLEARHFYSERHRHVYEAMIALDARSEPIDRVTLKGELTRLGLFEAVGGDDLVDVLDKIVPGAATAYYARLVVNASLYREILDASITTAQEARAQEGTAQDLLDAAEERLSRLRSADRTNATTGTRELLVDATKRIQAAYEGTAPKGLPTGIDALDDMTTGFRPGELIILAARPSVGKTAAALNWAQNIAIKCKRTVLVFEMEMPKHDVVNRMISSVGRVDLKRLRSGALLESDWSKLSHAATILAEARFEVSEMPGISAMEIRGVSRRAARKAPSECPLGLIVVDYLQLMRGDERIDSREQQVSAAALSLKHLAGELGVPVLVLSQINRASEKRPDGRPRISDLRESGAIEQHADTVIFAHRPWVHDKTQPEEAAEFIVGKQRNGPIGTVEATFDGPHVTFHGVQRGPGRPDWHAEPGAEE